MERNFRAGEEFEQAIVERRPFQFLYRQGDEFVFMDVETYDQVTLSSEQVGEDAQFLKEGTEVILVFHEGEPLMVELPTAVELQVVETDPASGAIPLQVALSPQNWRLVLSFKSRCSSMSATSFALTLAQVATLSGLSHPSEGGKLP